MIERFINKHFIKTNFKEDKLTWIIGLAYLLYFSIGQLEGYATLTLWVMFPAAFAYIFFNHFFISYSKLPKSLLLYGSFAIWAILSGLPLYIDDILFFTHVRRVVICFILMACVCIALNKGGNFKILFLCYYLSSLFICGYSLYSGDLTNVLNQEDFSYEYDGTTYITAERLYGLAGNSNGMGGYAILGFIAISLLFFETKSVLVKLFYVAGALLFFFTIAAAGTRGGVLITGVYGTLWMLITLRSRFKISPTYFFLLALLAGVAYYGYENVIKTTTIGLRIDTESNYKEDKRYEILINAIDVFTQYPVTGVGLAQFELYSYDQAITHNDYLEVLTNTGFVGGILYYSMFAIIITQVLTLRRKAGAAGDREVVYNLNFMLTIFITTLIYGFIRHHLWDFSFMMMLSIMSGYCFYMQNNRYQKQAQQRYAMGYSGHIPELPENQPL